MGTGPRFGFGGLEELYREVFVMEGQRRFDRGRNFDAPREMHDVTCADCGKQTQVPFKPDGSRPVYCKDCYQNHRPKRY